ncbi:MAG: SufE family protein [Bacteroidota bacterium]
MNIADIQQQVIKEFASIDDWLDKYEYLTDLAKKLPSTNGELKTENHKIGGCQSNVWIKASKTNGTIHYEADSDTQIIKGIIALLLKVYNGQPPKAIINSDPEFIDKIGLKSNLSPSRANGISSIMKRIQEIAVEYDKKY